MMALANVEIYVVETCVVRRILSSGRLEGCRHRHFPFAIGDDGRRAAHGAGPDYLALPGHVVRRQMQMCLGCAQHVNVVADVSRHMCPHH